MTSSRLVFQFCMPDLYKIIQKLYKIKSVLDEILKYDPRTIEAIPKHKIISLVLNSFENIACPMP